jgi:hypothetical protein
MPQPLLQKLDTPSTPERGDPIFGVSLVERVRAPMPTVVNGYVVEDNDGQRRRIVWNSFLGWVVA